MVTSDVHKSVLCFFFALKQGTGDISFSTSTTVADSSTANNVNKTPLSPSHCYYSPLQRPVIYQSPKLPPRMSPPEIPAKPTHLPGLISHTDDFLSQAEDNQVTSPQAEKKLVSPLPSPRSFSKIPTPLPRKTNVMSPTSPPRKPIKSITRQSDIPVPIKSDSDSSPASPNISSASSPFQPSMSATILSASDIESPPSTPQKILPMSPHCSPRKVPQKISSQTSSDIYSAKFSHEQIESLSPSKISHLHSSNQASKIPSPPSSSLSSFSTSPPTNPKPLPDEATARRRTVVEVCEKTLVSVGHQPQVTPFITLEKYTDEVSRSTEVRVDQQYSSAYKLP